MLGMSFLPFLILTLIGAVVAVAYYNVIRYRFLEGHDALSGKLIIGYPELAGQSSNSTRRHSANYRKYQHCPLPRWSS